MVSQDKQTDDESFSKGQPEKLVVGSASLILELLDEVLVKGGSLIRLLMIILHKKEGMMSLPLIYSLTISASTIDETAMGLSHFAGRFILHTAISDAFVVCLNLRLASQALLDKCKSVHGFSSGLEF